LASDRSQVDCIVDQKAEHKSELFAVTTSLDCHWYSVSDAAEAHEHAELRECEEGPGCISVELLAVLKRPDLSTKLRKMDFRELNVCCVVVFTVMCEPSTNFVLQVEG
jgi:hypothetical protein